MPSPSYISDHWPDIEESLSDMLPDYANRITTMVKYLTPQFPRIEAYATSLHPQRRKCQILRDRYTWGQSFLVFEIYFPPVEPEQTPTTTMPCESWIIRFGLRPLDDYFHTSTQLSRKILNEVAALHIVRTRTTIPVPTILAYHSFPSSDNPLGGEEFPPFVMMTALRGVTITDLGIKLDVCVDPGADEEEEGELDDEDDDDPLGGDESKRPILERYVKDLADMHHQLSKIRFDKLGSFVLEQIPLSSIPTKPKSTSLNINQDQRITIGPGADFGIGPFPTSSSYFTLQALSYEKIATIDPSDTSLSRHRKQFVSSLWRAAIFQLLDKRDEEGPFPMHHGDLHHENILVDENGGIVGVLDWDCAGAVPWEVFAVPSFELSGRSWGTGGSERRKERKYSLVLHDMFNQALVELEEKERAESQPGPLPPSGRSLAVLHGSDAGHVGSYLAYWMYSLVCDFEHTGRVLWEILGWEGDIEAAFNEWVTLKTEAESGGLGSTSDATSGVRSLIGFGNGLGPMGHGVEIPGLDELVY